MHSTFEKLVIVEVEDAASIRAGLVQFAIPEFTMHSFEATNNKIEWFLKVHGNIKKWPDVSDEFSIQVLPLEAGER